MNFTNFKIGARLGLGFGLIATFAILIGAVSLIQLAWIDGAIDELSERRLPDLIQVSDALRQQEVAGEAVADLHGLAHLAQSGDAFEKNDFHDRVLVCRRQPAWS